jgi:hypothetical protein
MRGIHEPIFLETRLRFFAVCGGEGWCGLMRTGPPESVAYCPGAIDTTEGTQFVVNDRGIR